MRLSNKGTYTAKLVNRLVKYKWFRRACGGHWYLVTDEDTPDLRMYSYWVQFKTRHDLPTSKEKLQEISSFKNVYDHEYWGDAYTDVSRVLEK